MQVVGGDQDRAVLVPEHRVGRRVAGPVEDLQRRGRAAQRLAVARAAGHLRRPPQARNDARHRAQRDDDVAGMPWRASAPRRSASSRSASVAVVARSTGASSVERRDLGAERRARIPARPRWSMCWWVTDPLEVLDPRGRGRRARARARRAPCRSSARVDERQRLVLDQVAVDPADRERRGDGEAVDPGAAARPWSSSASPSSLTSGSAAEHLVAPALHVLVGDERLQAQAQQRLGVRRAHVEVPVVVVDRDAVERGVTRAVRVALARCSPSSPAGRRPRS